MFAAKSAKEGRSDNALLLDCAQFCAYH